MIVYRLDDSQRKITCRGCK